MDFEHQARLTECVLGLGRPVVAVALAATAEDYDALGVRELRQPLTFCAMARLAATGRGRKATGAQFRCPGAAEVFRFTEPGESALSGERLHGFGLYADVETARRVQAVMPRLAEPCHGVGVLELAQCARAPQSVLLFVNGYQAMRLIQGWAYHHGPIESFFAVGNRGMCAESVARPLATGAPHLSSLCANTRHTAQWEDGELCMGVPYPALESVLDGLVRTIPAVEPPDRRAAIAERCQRRGVRFEVPAGDCYFL